MTDTSKVHFRREGSTAFPVEAEKEPSEASPAAETEVETPAAEAADTAVAPEVTTETKPKPFNEDPAIQEYIGRQVDTRTKAAIEELRKEFGSQREANADQEKIPSWFGGNQEQWNEYRADLDARLKGAEERAISGVIERSTKQTETEQAAVKEATDFLNSELAAITADKTLNPSGKPVDANALFKVVLDNQLVDTKGRWNYRAGMRIMGSHSTAVHAPVTVASKDRKALAGATVDRGGGGADGADKSGIKTSEDFKKKRPW